MKSFIAIITLTLVTGLQSLSIPDQQTIEGKLFYYKINFSSLHDLKHINITEADSNSGRLPDWLYFKPDSHELIGIPLEKGLFFIEIQVKYYGKQQMNDIFAIEVVDGSQPQGDNHSDQTRCVLRIKQTFDTLSDVWRLISSLMSQYLTSNQNSNTFREQMKRFSFTRNNNKYLITHDIESCDSNQLSEEYDSSGGLRTKLKSFGIDFDVIAITKRYLDELEFNNVVSTRMKTNDVINSKSNSHFRRNIADAINPTPVPVPDWMTLTTSTIIPSTDGFESSEPDPLSRVLIPSMTSPTVNSASVTIPTADPIENSIEHGIRHHPHSGSHKYKTPYIYTTPVLSPERPTIIEGQDLFTPIPITPTSVPQTSSHYPTDSVIIAPSPSVVPEITSSQIETTTQEKPTTERPEIPSTSSTVPNKNPYINKRLRKLELTSGKYWKYTIPSETFVDFEDGNTRKLKLTLLMSTSGVTQEQPTSEFWLQFDHENQYLYALPTDEDIGKHLFDLVAVDSSGAHVTETLEVHVRQHKNTRAFTHIFTLSNVVWDPFQFACLIEATSSLLKRVTTRVFSDSNIQTIAVQKIAKNEKENTWTISWTNDTLPTHPCPRDMIQYLYDRLHDPNKVYDDSSAEPSRALRQYIGPEFRVDRVHLNFITKSACGSYEIPDIDDKKSKESPIFRNRIGKLGPFRLGEAFKYKIPEDTVFSPARQVGTRELSLSLQSIEPPEMPDFISFDSEEQEIFGLALSKDRVNSYELNLIAEDTISGGTANDIFSIDIIDDTTDRSKQPAFEVVINLLGSPGKEEMSVKEKVEVVQRISSGMFNDGDSSAVHILSIDIYQYDGLSPVFSEDNNYLEDSDQLEDNESNDKESHKHNKHMETAPKTRHSRDANALNYFALKWTNRTISGHENCPKDSINENILKRVFERDFDSLKVLKEVFEPNYDLINVEFQPLGVCKNRMSPKVMGPRPIPFTGPPSTPLTPTKPSITEEEEVGNAVDIDESNEFLLTTIIPPVAILIALIFAAIVGCCFHRANKRRKSVEISSRLPGETGLNEREAFLQKGRIPIIFEFEQQQQQQHNVPQQQPQQYNMTPVIMPPSHQPIPPQQMTPLRQLSSTDSKPTYQSVPQSAAQRRQPPPYYNE